MRLSSERDSLEGREKRSTSRLCAVRQRVGCGRERAQRRRCVCLPVSARETPLTKLRKSQATTTIDPLSRTIIIHPGSRFLRLGLASSLAPVAVPNVIARKQRNFVPPPPSTSTKGKERETPLPPQAFAAPTTAVPEQGPNALTGIAAPAGVKPEEIVAAVVKQEAQAGGGSTPSALSGLPPLPSFGAESAPPSATAAADGDVSMAAPASSSSSSASPPPPSTNSLDPLDAKISSLKGDLRARMRVFKLRGQGNGNNQASEFNRGVVGERMGEDFEGVGEVEWTVEEGEVFVGNKVLFFLLFLLLSFFAFFRTLVLRMSI